LSQRVVGVARGW